MTGNDLRIDWYSFQIRLRRNYGEHLYWRNLVVTAIRIYFVNQQNLRNFVS